MRPLPIPEDFTVPHGIMARTPDDILLMCGHILIDGVLGASLILETPHIFA
uniref:Uncharacterized protein n=1 Tax=Oryza brachyantha TaxID=4533 RepID=J3MGY0_ORYBR